MGGGTPYGRVAWGVGWRSLRWAITIRYLGLVDWVWLVVRFYALPYLMEQEHKSLRLALRNGFSTLLAAPGYTTLLIVVVGPIATTTLQTKSGSNPQSEREVHLNSTFSSCHKLGDCV